MTRPAVHPLGVTLLSGLVLFGVGCSSTLPAGTTSPEPQAQAMPPVRDRGLELATLRAELAATKIAAAKKEAELLELRDLVKQLRLEHAESRQAFLELRDQADQRQRDQEHARGDQDRQAKAHATEDLSTLKETVVTLAQELGQLRQDLTKSVSKEQGNPIKPGSSMSAASGLQASRLESLQREPVISQHAVPSSAMPSSALTVTADVVPDPHGTVTVQPGDTLASLAKRHRTTVEVLRKLNILKGDTVIIGRALVLPTTQEP